MQAHGSAGEPEDLAMCVYPSASAEMAGQWRSPTPPPHLPCAASARAWGVLFEGRAAKQTRWDASISSTVSPAGTRQAAGGEGGAAAAGPTPSKGGMDDAVASLLGLAEASSSEEADHAAPSAGWEATGSEPSGAVLRRRLTARDVQRSRLSFPGEPAHCLRRQLGACTHKLERQPGPGEESVAQRQPMCLGNAPADAPGVSRVLQAVPTKPRAPLLRPRAAPLFSLLFGGQPGDVASTSSVAIQAAGSSSTVHMLAAQPSHGGAAVLVSGSSVGQLLAELGAGLADVISLRRSGSTREGAPLAECSVAERAGPAERRAAAEQGAAASSSPASPAGSSLRGGSASQPGRAQQQAGSAAAAAAAAAGEGAEEEPAAPGTARPAAAAPGRPSLDGKSPEAAAASVRCAHADGHADIIGWAAAACLRAMHAVPASTAALVGDEPSTRRWRPRPHPAARCLLCPPCLLQLLAAVAEEDARPGPASAAAAADPDWQASRPKARGRPRKRRPASAGSGRQVRPLTVVGRCLWVYAGGCWGGWGGRVRHAGCWLWVLIVGCGLMTRRASVDGLCRRRKLAGTRRPNAPTDCSPSLLLTASTRCGTLPLPHTQGDAAPVQCGHCGTGETPRWWNLPTGTLCNACGIWLKRHGGWPGQRSSCPPVARVQAGGVLF